MRTDVRPDVRRVPSEPAIQPVRRAPLALVLTGLVLAVGLALSGAVSVVRGGEDGAGIRTAGGPRPTATVLGTVFTSTVPPDLATTVPRAKAGTRSQPAGTAAPTGRATTVAPPPATSTPPTTAASPGTTAAPQPTVQAGGQAAASTVPACRNSTDPACGDFRFDPQPGADDPMTVEVTAVPSSPVAGQPMVFRVTLRDPDGVSYGASNFFFGDSGISDSKFGQCKKFGPWDPPARDPSQATVVQEVGHTYAQAGSYTATFTFEAGPFECVDGVSGRGDRPYASSALGSVTVVVR